MKVLLFTGKGGVGKTTISAATALYAAKLGYKTMIISTDPAHSLSDSLDLKLSPEPEKVDERFYAMEIDVQHELEKYWGEVKNYLTALFSSQGLQDVVAEELAILPGFDEIASMLYIAHFEEAKKFDLLVIDCAPTGESLRLLSFPDVMRWYMEKIYGLERKLMKAVRPIAKMVSPVPLPSDEVYVSIETLYRRITRVKGVLENPDRTSIRLVVNPEKMVIKETQRGYAYLNLFGYPVDAVIVNKILPPEVKGGYFEHWKRIQEEHMKTIEESFYPLPTLKCRLFEREIVGKELLLRLAEEVYGGRDPTEPFIKETPIKFAKENGHYTMTVKLPFASKEDLEVYAGSEEIIVRMKGWKRNFLLPQALAGLSLKKAKFDGNILQIVLG